MLNEELFIDKMKAFNKKLDRVADDMTTSQLHAVKDILRVIKQQDPHDAVLALNVATEITTHFLSAYKEAAETRQ